MTLEEIVSVVRTESADVIGVEPDEISPNADIIAEFGVDSLELMEIGTRLEALLRFRIDPARLRETRTVADVAGVLYESLAGR